MKDIESLFDKAVAEIDRILNSKTVVGEPIEVGGSTLIPLLTVGFGFGVGAGEGNDPQKGQGHGGGTGGGGGVRPVAVVIIDADGVRIEPIKSGSASVLEKVAEGISRAASARSGDATESTGGTSED
jgi:uncharacterized spore protein YtfJ